MEDGIAGLAGKRGRYGRNRREEKERIDKRREGQWMKITRTGQDKSIPLINRHQS